MKEKEKTYWLNQKIFEYQDPITTNNLEIQLCGGLTEPNNYISTFVKMIIKDNRIANGSKVYFSLSYNELYNLLYKISDEIKDLSTVFANGNTISVHRYTNQYKKDLIFDFILNNEKQTVRLKILDVAGGIKELVILLDLLTFKKIYDLLKDIKDTYNTISTNFMIASGQERLYNQLQVLNSNILELSNKKDNYVVINNVTNKEDIDVEEEDEDPIVDTSDVDNFNAVLEQSNGFDHIKLDIDIPQVSIKEEKPINTFLSFLNNDITQYKPWLDSIVFMNEKSKVNSPFDNIMQRCMINTVEIDNLKNNQHYYFVQYGLITYAKKTIKNYLQGSPFPNISPIFRFTEDIKRGTELYDLSQNILITQLLHGIINKTCLSQIDGGSKELLDYSKELKICYWLSQIFYGVFIYSIEKNNELYNDIMRKYSIYETCGAMNKIKEDYSRITMGGTLPVTQEVFGKTLEQFLKLDFSSLPSIETASTELSKFDIRYTPMTSWEAASSNIFSDTLTDTQHNELENDLKPELNSPLDIAENPRDTRMSLFLECCKDYLYPTQLETLMNSCLKYDDIINYLKEGDWGDNVYKIKRIMDQHPEMTMRSKILKAADDLKEENNLTMSRVLQEETISKVEEPSFSLENMVNEL